MDPATWAAIGAGGTALLGGLVAGILKLWDFYVRSRTADRKTTQQEQHELYEKQGRILDETRAEQKQERREWQEARDRFHTLIEKIRVDHTAEMSAKTVEHYDCLRRIAILEVKIQRYEDERAADIRLGGGQ